MNKKKCLLSDICSVCYERIKIKLIFAIGCLTLVGADSEIKEMIIIEIDAKVKEWI